MTKYGEGEDEEDCDCSWMGYFIRKRLDGITDVNNAERSLMKMWNGHVAKFKGRGFRHLDEILTDFLTEECHMLIKLNLYRSFMSHIASLQQSGLISMEKMLYYVNAMQVAMNVIKDTKTVNGRFQMYNTIPVISPSRRNYSETIIPVMVSSDQNTKEIDGIEKPSFCSLTIYKGKKSDSSEDEKEGDGEIRIGREYQAVPPPYIPPSERKEDLADERALLVWAPQDNADHAVLDQFVITSKEKFGYNIEQALAMLLLHKYDTEAALVDLSKYAPRIY